MEKWLGKLMVVFIGVPLALGMLFLIVGIPFAPRRPDRPAAPSGFGRRMLREDGRAETARRLGEARDAAAVPYLAPFLKDPDPEVRAACAWALGQIGDASLVMDLRIRMEKEPDPAVRRALADALARLGDPTAVRTLAERVEDADPAVRVAAVRALAAVRGDAARAGLAKALANPHAEVRNTARAALIEAGPPAFDALLRAARRTRNEKVHVAVAEVLAADGTARAVPALLALVGATDDADAARQVHATAVRALAALGEEAAPAILAAARDHREPGDVYKDPHAWSEAPISVRRAAAEALGHIGGEEVVALLNAAIIEADALPPDEDVALWQGALARIRTPDARQASERITAHVVTRKKEAVEAALAARVAAGRVAAGASAPPEAEDATYALVLVDAMGGAEMTVWLDHRGGMWQAAFATALDYSKSSHAVDASALELEGRRLAGRIDVTLSPDPWVVATPTPWAAEIDARIEGGEVAGTYRAGRREGKVRGVVQTRGAPEPAWLHLLLEDALVGIYDGSYHHRAYISFVLDQGRTRDGRFTEFDQRIPNRMSIGWNGMLESADVRLDLPRFAADVRTLVTSTKGHNTSWGPHRFELEGYVIGTAAGGTFRTFIEDTLVQTGRFVGEVGPAARSVRDMENFVLVIEMKGAVRAEPVTRVPLVRAEGAFRPATILLDGRPGRLNPSKLAVEGRTVRGPLRLTYTDETQTHVACAYEIEADVSHARVTGSFKGRCGSEPVSGPIAGRFLPRRD